MNRMAIWLTTASLLLGPLGLAQEADKPKAGEGEAAPADPIEAAVAKISGFKLAPTPRPAMPEFPTPVPGPIDRKALEAPRPTPAAEGPITEGTIDGHPFRVFWNGVDATMLLLKPAQGQGGDLLGMLVGHYVTMGDGQPYYADWGEGVHLVMPDGKSVLFNRLTTASNRITARWHELRDMRTGRVLQRYSNHESAAGYSRYRSGKVVSKAGFLGYTNVRFQDDKPDVSELFVWDLNGGSRERLVGRHTGDSYDRRVAFSPDGKLIIVATVGDHDNPTELAMHDVASGRTLWQQRSQANKIEYGCVAFAPDGQWVAVGIASQPRTPSEQIRLLAPHTGRTIRTIATGMSIVREIAVSPDGSFLAYHGKVKVGETPGVGHSVWTLKERLHVEDTSTWRRIKTIQCERDVEGVWFTHGSDLLVYRDRGGVVRAVRLKSAPTPTRPEPAAEEPPMAEPPAELGDLFAETDDWEEAEEAYAKAAEASPDDPSQRQRLAVAQFQQGKFAEAAKAASKAVELRPDDPSLQNLYATIRAKQEQWGEAEKALRTAVRLQPKNAVYQANLANVLLYQDKVDDAVAAATEARRLGKDLEHPVYPKVAQRVGEEAARSLREGRADAAATAYRSAAKFDPKNAAYRAGLGEALLAAGSHDEAAKALGEAVKLAPESAAYQATLGKAWAAAGKHDGAAQAYAEAAWLEPARQAHHYKLGNALFALKRHDEAEAAFRKAVELAPTNAFSHHWLGNALYEQERYEEAEEHFRKAAELKPDDAGNQGWLGECLSKLGRHADAAAAFREWARLQPTNGDAQYRLGRALLQQGKYREAEEPFRKAVELKPDDAANQGWLGAALCQQKRYKEAEGPLRKAIALKPDDAFSQGWLGQALCQLETYKEAEEHLRRAVKLKPNDPANQGWLGLCLYKLGRHADAAVAFRGWTQLQPTSDDAYQWLGRALFGQRKYEEAENALRKAVELGSGDAANHAYLAHALLRQGKREEALACARKALELGLRSHDVYKELGIRPDRTAPQDGAKPEGGEAAPKQAPAPDAGVRGPTGAEAPPPPLKQRLAELARRAELLSAEAKAAQRRGLQLMEQQKWAEAVLAFQEAARREPDWPAYRKNLGDALSAAGKLAEAVQAYQESVRLDPYSFSGYQYLGGALFRAERYAESEAACRRALELMPFAARVHYDLGHAVLRQGRVEEARQLVEEAKKKHALDHPVVAELGRAEDGKPPAAPRPPEQKPTGRRTDDTVVGVYLGGDLLPPPTKVRAVAERAAELRKQKKWAEAVIAYQEAVRLAPEYAPYRNSLGCALCDVKQYAAAEAAFREAVKLNSGSGTPHANLAWALLKLDRRGDAEREARKAVALGLREHPVLGKLDIKAPAPATAPTRPPASQGEGPVHGDSRMPPRSGDDLPDAVTRDLVIE